MHLPSVLCVMAAAVIAAAGGRAHGQAAPATPIDGLSIVKFLRQAEPAVAPKSTSSEEAKELLREEAARRLADQGGEALTLVHTRRLLRLAGDLVGEEERQEIYARVSGSDGELSGMRFKEMRARYLLELELGDPQNVAAVAELVEAWLAAQELAEAPYEHLLWAVPRMSRWASSARGFTVVWTGRVTPPRAGEYVFSVSPHNVHTRRPGASSSDASNEYRQTVKVSVAGEQVVSASPESWANRGAAVSLQEGVPVELRYEFTYDCPPEHNPHRFAVQDAQAPFAALYWEGPGFTRQLVPADALSRPGGSGPGLVAAYKAEGPGGGALQRSVVEPSIDRLWVGGCGMAGPQNATREAAVDRVWQSVMVPAFFAESFGEADPKKRKRLHHPFVGQPQWAAELSSTRRAEFLRRLADSDDALDRLTFNRLLAVYHRYRFGAEEEAIALVGEWMQRRPHLPTGIAHGSWGLWWVRSDYRAIDFCTLIYPPHFEALGGYLEDEQGGCCLPVACTLAYGHLHRGSMAEWIAGLDARLEDGSLAGDERVNWLLARAAAEEVRYGQSGPSYRVVTSVTKGLPWIEEAILVVESDGTRRRAERERLARLTAAGDLDEAAQYLAEMGGETDAYAARIEGLRELAARQAERSAESADQAYLEMLKERRNRAIHRGDQQMKARYDAAIAELEEGDAGEGE